MKKLLVLTVLICSMSNLWAQEYVIGEKSKEDTIVKKDLTLIPFQNKYYRSEIDRSLASSEGMDVRSLRDRLRKELDKQLFMILNEDYDVYSFLKNGSEEEMEILDYIFNATAGSYSELESDEKVERKLLNRGQIKEAPISEGQRYMKTVIHHPPLIKTLGEEVPSDYYLFIGELDILMPTSIEEKENYRYIYVHYTLYDNKGEIVKSGMVTQMLSVRKCRKIKDISLSGFSAIAYQMRTLLEEYK